ncbi:MAG: hypothetical protein ACXWT4_06065 [Methylobacter sp.]
MIDTIIVTYNGEMLLVCKETGDELNLHQGQIITDSALFWQIIGHNASMMLAKIAIAKAQLKVNE